MKVYFVEQFSDIYVGGRDSNFWIGSDVNSNFSACTMFFYGDLLSFGDFDAPRVIYRINRLLR